MKLNVVISATALITAMIWGANASSDVIYFKNGGTVEGTIQKEDDNSVIIDLGVGTMTVRQDEIENIKKSSGDDLERLEQEERAGEISRGEWAPLGCEEVRMAYLKTKKDRESLEKARDNSSINRDEISQKEGDISELLKALDKKSNELKMIDSSKRTKEYNAVVAEMNSLSAKLNAENGGLTRLHAKEKEINAVLAEKAGKYRADFQAFKDALKKKQNAADTSMLSGDETSFFEEMGNKMSEMESNFKKGAVDYTSESNQVIVDALINNNVLVRMVVDTGASIVVISREVADRLGVSEEGADTEIEVLMANGAAVNAVPVILKSVKVGDAEVKNVHAAILENGTIGGVDGLLGMSFLSSFIVSLDSASNKLILEQVL